MFFHNSDIQSTEFNAQVFFFIGDDKRTGADPGRAVPMNIIIDLSGNARQNAISFGFMAVPEASPDVIFLGSVAHQHDRMPIRVPEQDPAAVLPCVGGVHIRNLQLIPHSFITVRCPADMFKGQIGMTLRGTAGKKEKSDEDSSDVFHFRKF